MLFIGTPLAGFAAVKPDVWKPVSIKVSGKDAIPYAGPPANTWKGPAGGVGPTVSVEVIWEPSGFGGWSHLADKCYPNNTGSPPKAYIGITEGGTASSPSGDQGTATVVDTADNQVKFTYTGVPKNSNFYVYMKCDAPIFAPNTELSSTFDFVDLKYNLGVSAASIAAGGFDPYGFAAATSVEVDMPGDPGKYLANSPPKNNAIFIKAITTNPPQQVRGQYQRAIKYQLGGMIGDIPQPADKVWVTQWANHAGPIDSPTSWNSLVDGGLETIKGVFTEMGNSPAAFPPGFYRFRVRAEDGELKGWSNWWSFWVGEPSSAKAKMLSAADVDLYKMMQGGGSNDSKGNKRSAAGQTFGRQASKLGVTSKKYGGTSTAKSKSPSKRTVSTEILSMDLKGSKPIRKGQTLAAVPSPEKPAAKQDKGKTQVAKMTRVPLVKEIKPLKFSVVGKPVAGKAVQLKMVVPSDAASQVTIHCLKGSCAGKKWNMAMASKISLPTNKVKNAGKYELKLQTGRYIGLISFEVSPAMRATAAKSAVKVKKKSTLQVIQ